ncbi:DUF4349 domain-containing protein [Parablautia muri]|uniref:DUF4349 domain-containing protein n=1 Tax=Parablautia muri TaxID=2320879 RepID=A0A9X5BD90_9FIRM|nr:DUF4349 domain-containing protein [Parablautia muri]NBJ91559.1 DUF4349 domain-containing protein [Parablautia muri]
MKNLRMISREKEKRKLLLFFIIMAFLLSGCGGASKSTGAMEAADTAMQASGATDNGYADAGGYAMEAAAEAGELDALEGDSETPKVQSTQRKLIKNVNLEVETEAFEDLLADVKKRTEQFGGYIEESYAYNGSNYYGKGNRNANLTIRIPAEKLDAFLSMVSENSNVISQNESVTDVTLQYVDMESHKKALTAEQERLLELLEKAETVEDIITLESRLSEVRYLLESMESQLRTMDNQVSYSTVYLYINEVTKYTPVQEMTPWEKISTGFMGSLYDIGNGMVNFGIDCMINLPYLILWAVILLIVFFMIHLIVKLVKKKRGIKQEKKMRRNPGQPEVNGRMDGQIKTEEKEEPPIK